MKEESHEALNLQQDKNEAIENIKDEFNSSIKKSKKEYKKTILQILNTVNCF